MDFTKPTNFEASAIANTYSVMPTREQIPEEFWDFHNKWNEYISNLFFIGGVKAKTKDGISFKDAWKQLGFILSSWDTEHGHKIAACAYLASLWLVQDLPLEHKNG